MGAARDLGPIVRLGYGSLRHTTAGSSPVLVADNGCDAEARAYLSAQQWIRLFPLEERITASHQEHEAAARVLASLWTEMGAVQLSLTAAERRLLTLLQSRVHPEPALSPEDQAQLGQTIDFLLPQVRTRYTVLVDSDVEFIEPGWLSDMVEMMNDNDIDLFGFLEPARHPIQERFATFVLAMRTAEILALDCSFATSLSFGAPAEATIWHSRNYGKFLDTTAFTDFPTARFHDTAAQVYESARAHGLNCTEFPSRWRRKFLHLEHMAWADSTDDSYAGADALRHHRHRALAYARARCELLGIGIPG